MKLLFCVDFLKVDRNLQTSCTKSPQSPTTMPPKKRQRDAEDEDDDDSRAKKILMDAPPPPESDDEELGETATDKPAVAGMSVWCVWVCVR